MTSADAASARTVYDRTAHLYAELVGTEVRPGIEAPIDRHLLASFADAMGGSPAGAVVDLGCGPGRIAAFLAARGVPTIGLDLSLEMLAVAAASHRLPGLIQGELASLPLADRSLAGAVGWYSIIHTPPDGLAGVAGELARVLRPGGHLLLGFQSGGGERVDRRVAGRPDTMLTSYRHDADRVADHLRAAGIGIGSITRRRPESGHETTPQAFIVGRRGDRARGQAGCAPEAR